MKPEYPERTSDDEHKNMSHNTARNFKPQLGLEPTLSHWWQSLARKTDVLTVALRVCFEINISRF